MRHLTLTALMLFLAACHQPQEAPLTIAVAAGMAPAMQQILATFSQTHDIPVHMHSASSGTIAGQIRLGASIDVMIAADPEWLDRLIASGHLDPATYQVIAHDRLCLLVAPGLTAPRLADGPVAGTWAIADPAHAPLGRHARHVLQRLGWWDALQDRLVLAQDARAVAQMIASGHVQAGIVYRSSLGAQPGPQALELPPHLHGPIRFAAAATSRDDARIALLLDFLHQSQSQDLLMAARFQRVDQP